MPGGARRYSHISSKINTGLKKPKVNLKVVIREDPVATPEGPKTTEANDMKLVSETEIVDAQPKNELAVLIQQIEHKLKAQPGDLPHLPVATQEGPQSLKANDMKLVSETEIVDAQPKNELAVLIQQIEHKLKAQPGDLPHLPVATQEGPQSLKANDMKLVSETTEIVDAQPKNGVILMKQMTQIKQFLLRTMLHQRWTRLFIWPISSFFEHLLALTDKKLNNTAIKEVTATEEGSGVEENTAALTKINQDGQESRQEEKIVKGTDSRIYCIFCEYKTSSKHNLIRHHRSNHKDKAEPFVCGLSMYCHLSFRTEKERFEHMESTDHADLTDDFKEFTKTKCTDCRSKPYHKFYREHIMNNHAM
ncbi:uncharacterized protein LOC132195194 [Neocloeon triangulifer]|uniref:uncharacterized protein LOC132195194 n=1 Tax=Neocloeon triangulifer TaxID=2078957 RepID=UPI00286F3006|nr:uncharacterized protein LOC132195194 [Neocloeon triangulifer]